MRWLPTMLIVTFTLPLLLTAVGRAELRLAPTFADHAVLQRGVAVPVWGQATPGEKVTVRLGDREAGTKADESGAWRVTLDPLDAGGPVKLTVTGADGEVSVEDVMVGEVWICAGQSNMQFGLKSAATAKEAITEADLPAIRQYRYGKWMVAGPETAGGFSAVGFFFARDLHEKLDVPVGIINTAIGGTPAAAWTPREALAADEFLRDHVLGVWDAYVKRYDAILKEYQALKQAGSKRMPAQPVPPDDRNRPGNLFKDVVEPIVPHAVRGVLWYQGESDAWGFPIGDVHYRVLPALIRGWRSAWAQPTLYWITIQLPDAPGRDLPRPLPPSPWKLVQEAHLRTLDMPDTGVVVTVDLGENDIHPKRKRPVGHRSALVARALVYGERDLAHSGPMFERMEIEDGKVRLHFAHAEGLRLTDRARAGFAVAGEDRYFVHADARVEGDTVVVWSEDVPDPAAVRYAWAEGSPAGLYNAAGLPASPFRTDEWAWDTPARSVRKAKATKAAAAAKIDGELDDAAWDQSLPVGELTLRHTYRPARQQTRARFSYDADTLYVAVRCEEPGGEAVASAEKRDDAGVLDDDSIELLLDADDDDVSFCRIAVNAAGTVLDGKGWNDSARGPRVLSLGTLANDRGWDATWNAEGLEVATAKTKDGWTVEMAIPAAALGLDKIESGETMGLQLIRNRVTRDEDALAGAKGYARKQIHLVADERSTWQTTGRDYNTGAMMPTDKVLASPARFGELTFE